MAGRPTKLTPELKEEAKAYLEELNVSISTLLPTVEGMALRLGISRDTIYEWEKQDKQFSDIVNDLRSKQGEKLIQNALAGRYNASIAKLILSGKHGYIEQSATDITTNGKDVGVAVNAEQAEQLIRARAERTDI